MVVCVYIYIVAGPTRKGSVGLARLGVCVRGGWFPPFVCVANHVVTGEGAASRGSGQPWGEGEREVVGVELPACV